MSEDIGQQDQTVSVEDSGPDCYRRFAVCSGERRAKPVDGPVTEEPFCTHTPFFPLCLA